MPLRFHVLAISGDRILGVVRDECDAESGAVLGISFQGRC